MKAFIVGIGLVLSSLAHAEDGLYMQPQLGVGVNSAQGTSISLGLDIGYRFLENWSVGVGGHYAFGNYPENDREYGVGPFLGYAVAMNEFIVLHARQEILQLDVRNPYDPKPVTGPKYEAARGAASITSAGLTFRLGRNIAISAGYRFVLGLGKSELGDGRSGPMFGLGIGF